MTALSKHLIRLLATILFISLAACGPALGSLVQPGTETASPAAPISPPGDSQTATPPDSGAASALLNTRWKLASITENGSDTPIPASLAMTLEFQTEGQVAGSGGCNSFGGQYAVEGDRLVFSQLVSTMMACTDENLMQLEGRYLKALNASGTFELADRSLTIQFDDGAGALHFVPQDQAATPTQGAAQLCTLTGASDPAWQTCLSPQYAFEVKIPGAATLTDNTAASARIDLPVAPGTNLVEKYLQIEARQNVSPCSSPMADGYAPGDVSRQPVQVNGVEFVKESRVGVATGNIYTWEAYSTHQGDLCLSLSFVLHSFDPQLQPTPPPEYDQASESAVFSQILSTFAWLSSSPAQPASPQSTPTPQRITFAPGGTSASESGQLTASGSALYVLRAQAGQTMRLDLTASQGRAILVVWGEDGTVLQTDHTEVTSLERKLPASQDYFIQVKGYPDGPTDYQLEITIPPA